MLRRAGTSSVLALLVGELSLRLHDGPLARYTRLAFFLLLGFAAVSLLFSLFEEPAGAEAESPQAYEGRISEAREYEHDFRRAEVRP